MVSHSPSNRPTPQAIALAPPFTLVIMEMVLVEMH